MEMIPLPKIKRINEIKAREVIEAVVKIFVLEFMFRYYSVSVA